MTPDRIADRNPEARSITRRERPRPPQADRILILRLGALGDVVRTLPAVARLRGLYPGAHLTWLVEPASAGVVEASGLVDEVLVFPRSELMTSLRAGDALSFARRGLSFARLLRARRFQLALDFHGLLKSGLLAWLSGAPVRVGFRRPLAREGSSLLTNHRVVAVDPEASRFRRNAALVDALEPRRPPGADGLGPSGLLGPSPLAEARLTARLRAAGREQARDYALIHPGSSAGARHKRYPPEAWVEVGRRLAAAGLEVWVGAGSSRHERQLAERIVADAEGTIVLAPETRSIDDLLALQRRAAVFLAADSGPLHTAALAGVPVVQLLGPTHPRQNEPWPGTPARRLRVPLPCSPCRRGCGDPACMRALSPASVAEAALALAGGARSAAARGGTSARPDGGSA